MIKENEFEFNTCNIIQWHEKGITGKGIKFASLENNTDHNKMVIDIVKQIAPDSIEYANYSLRKTGGMSSSEHTKDIAPDFEKFIDECIENNVDLITCSYNYDDNYARRRAIQKALDNGIIITWSAGNDNEVIPNTQVRYYFPEIIHVGAIFENSRQKIERAVYSNKGSLLDLVGFTSLTTTNKSLFTGTSCATPFVAGLIILLLQYLKDNNVSKSKYREIINNNILDLGTSGRDDLYGYGLFVLPNLNNFKIEKDKTIIKLQIGNDIIKINDIEKQIDVEPIIYKDRTLIPLRLIAELFNCKVEWNEELKQVTITKE